MTDDITSTFALMVAAKLDVEASSWREIVGIGEVNHVFVLETPEGDLVVRFHRDPLDTDDYSKEEWCLRSLPAEGIPTPEFIARGRLDGQSYMVQRFVAGTGGDDVRSDHLWRQLGRYARTINEISLDESAPDSLFPRFGRDLHSNWTKHIDYNIGELSQDDSLLSAGVYEPGGQVKLIRLFQWLAEKVPGFGLTHGDLVPKNVILPDSGLPVVLDWGSASAGPVPNSDYARIHFAPESEGYTEADTRAFADGYGIPLESILQILQAQRVLDSVDVCRWAIDNRPDRLDAYVMRASAVVRQFSEWV